MKERDSDGGKGLQGGRRGRRGNGETVRRGSRGGWVDRTGEGEDCELASDVALPFLGFTSFIRHAAGSSHAVELRFLLFWKHTKSENSRYCGCKGLKCFLFLGRAGLGWAGLGRGGDGERVKRKPRTDRGRIVKAQNYAMHKHARATTDDIFTMVERSADDRDFQSAGGITEQRGHVAPRRYTRVELDRARAREGEDAVPLSLHPRCVSATRIVKIINLLRRRSPTLISLCFLRTADLSSHNKCI